MKKVAKPASHVVHGFSMKFRLIPLITLLMFSCVKPTSEAYVMLDGKKITEADLISANPKEYSRLRKQYDSQIQDMLQDLAMNRMIERAAKEKGQSPQEYFGSIASKAESPSPDQIRKAYDELKSAGRINESFNQVEGELTAYLQRENGQKAIQKELAVLKEKYKYQTPKKTADIKGEPARGNPQAKVTIVEFTDFECPFCKKAQATTKQIRDVYGDKVRFVFKDFPLDFHAHAMGAHVAASCVNQLKADQYWNFFDSIFAADRDANVLDKDNLKKLAVSLGVDSSRYDACLSDTAIRKEIEGDIQEGQNLGVNGTPAFFINGHFISGAVPFEEFKNVIDQEL